MFRTFKLTFKATGESHTTQNYFVNEVNARKSVELTYNPNAWTIELVPEKENEFKITSLDIL